MKIGMVGLSVAEGKVKFYDERLLNLVEKVQPLKVTPYFVELTAVEWASADALAVSRDKALDICIQDIEKIETRLANSSDEQERAALQQCLPFLEKETPLCDAGFDAAVRAYLKTLAPLTFKPTVFWDAEPDINALVHAMWRKAGMMFFYTAGKKEVHAWPMPQGSDIVTCAGKIHSDLARGFIRGEVLPYADFLTVHSQQDAKNRGLEKLVERDYIVQDADIIEIRFSV